MSGVWSLAGRETCGMREIRGPTNSENMIFGGFSMHTWFFWKFLGIFWPQQLLYPKSWSSPCNWRAVLIVFHPTCWTPDSDNPLNAWSTRFLCGYIILGPFWVRCIFIRILAVLADQADQAKKKNTKKKIFQVGWAIRQDKGFIKKRQTWHSGAPAWNPRLITLNLPTWCHTQHGGSSDEFEISQRCKTVPLVPCIHRHTVPCQQCYRSSLSLQHASL